MYLENCVEHEQKIQDLFNENNYYFGTQRIGLCFTFY